MFLQDIAVKLNDFGVLVPFSLLDFFQFCFCNANDTIYVLGKSERFSGLYAQADFKQSAEKIDLKHNLFSVTIPTKIQYNFEPIRHWPETWRKQFVAEAYKTKHSFLGYYHELEPSLTAARLWINDKINRIRQLLAGNRQ